jgi:hypothetical protein
MHQFIAEATADLNLIVRSSELAGNGSFGHLFVGVSQFSMLMYQIALCFKERVSQYCAVIPRHLLFEAKSDLIHQHAELTNSDKEMAKRSLVGEVPSAGLEAKDVAGTSSSLVLSAIISSSTTQVQTDDQPGVTQAVDTVIDPRAYNSIFYMFTHLYIQ